MTTKAKAQARADALETMRKWGIKPGDTILTSLRHVSASGMLRSLTLTRLYVREGGQPDTQWLNRLVTDAGIGRWNPKRETVDVGGCGMDMGYHAVYNLSYALFPDGFGCIGKDCPSNDHFNGDRDYTPYWHRDVEIPPSYGIRADFSADHWHKDGGYALRHCWI